VPTLVLEGGKDKIKPPGWADEIAQQIPGARSLVIDDAGHCPQIERPDVVNQVLLGFFADGLPGEAANRDGSIAVSVR
jgi:pimeloyl-ACP methyl ester carboxylesterase